MTGPLLAAGRETDVYALRRYRREADVIGEAASVRRLAGLGYPAPAGREATGREADLTALIPAVPAVIDTARERIRACVR